MARESGKQLKKVGTMEELSAEIGISRPTLSKYFADPSSVRASMKVRIEEGLSTLDYVPNFFARNMNRRHTRLLGIVIPHANDAYFMELLESIEQRATVLDYSILIQNSHNDPQQELLAIENFRSMNAEGVLVSPIGSQQSVPEYQRLCEQLPIVFVNTKCFGLEQSIPFVGSDNQQSTRLMVDYLSRSGKPPIFLSLPSETNSNGLEREAGYRSRMAELGKEAKVISSDQAVDSNNFEHYAYALMKELFEDDKHHDATILCANDRLAMGVLRAANEMGFFVNIEGKQSALRVAGHDGHALCEYVYPSLTTVSQDVERIATTAVDCLCDLIQTNSSASDVEHLFEVQLKLRDSA